MVRGRGRDNPHWIDPYQRVFVMCQDLAREWDVGDVDIPWLREGAIWPPGLDIRGFDIVAIAKGYACDAGRVDDLDSIQETAGYLHRPHHRESEGRRRKDCDVRSKEPALDRIDAEHLLLKQRLLLKTLTIAHVGRFVAAWLLPNLVKSLHP